MRRALPYPEKIMAQKIMGESPKTRRRTNSKSEKKRPSFSNNTSPWVRRNSFLSNAMIQSENISVYESPNYYHDCSSYNIISLKECQGFIFNQDLFASPYQQSKSLANEKKYRSSFSHKPKSRTNSLRRHTSVNMDLPNFNSSILQGNAIDDEDSDHHTPNNTSLPLDSVNQTIDQFENTTVDISLSDNEMQEYEESNDSYKVRVTEIIVNENDDFFK
ncbi:hypothetical protein CLIB1444_01S14356 [[Candida] jaroonii]|uniref:Uncharacterized protein n=1 Tax=[Candida] jaroonii TaxID=467808 RepID=A0ACA9Y2E4_9ASCO|nr:hypothetical protein CLIB1444_01S14356 [[Candida] jaroonii]